jgi:hypothetical protein
MRNIEIVETVIFLIGMILYIRYFIVTDSIPHPVAFGIWLIADVINFITYVGFSKFWIAPALMPLTALIIVIIGIVKIKQTHREQLKTLDWVCIGIGIISLFVWVITQNALWSNMIIQIMMALGFVPIIGNLFNKKGEPLFPWFVFIVGWIITCVDVSMGCVSFFELIYPLINGLLGSSIIFIGSWIVIRQNAK